MGMVSETSQKNCSIINLSNLHITNLWFEFVTKYKPEQTKYNRIQQDKRVKAHREDGVYVYTVCSCMYSVKAAAVFTKK